MPDERRQRLAQRLERAGQGHVLAWADELSPAQLDDLLTQLESLELERLPALVAAALAPPPALEAEPDPPELIEWGSSARH
ncbi:MAG TPA: hypothetical protein VMV01_04125, partial [Planctomycetota bacterium]|nr:hypothetical protein [Planctomycetota bacterium]